MNLDLEKILNKNHIVYEHLEKKSKVKLLSKWIREFPELVSSARQQKNHEKVHHDLVAEEFYRKITKCNFYIFPDDDSDMPSYQCVSAKPPDLSELVSDTITKCDELVVIDSEFRWSAVFVNHGSPQSVSVHFSQK